MNITSFAIKYYQFTFIIFFMLFALGLLAFFTAPQSEDPMMDVPRVIVTIVYPGSTSLDMESQIGDPVEKSIQELDDLKEFSSSFENGVAYFRISFKHGVDPDEKYEKVIQQITSIQRILPSEIYDIIIQKSSTKNVPILQYAIHSPSANYRLLEKESKELMQMLEKIDGVRKTKTRAFPKLELCINLDPIRMKQLKVSIANIEQVVKANNAVIPGGSLRISSRLFNVNTSGAYKNIKEIQNTVIKNIGGKSVYLKDVASVYFDYENVTWQADYNGTSSILLDVFFKNDYSIFAVKEAVEKVRKTYEKNDKGVVITPIFDQSVSVKKRVNGFMTNLIQGIALVGCIIFLLLGIRSALLVGLAIPLSIMSSFWLLSFLEVGLHQMSIAGLIVSLGLLVDNSIVIVENINKKISELNLSPKDAAISSSHELLIPISSATLTTVFAFIPLIAMPENTGDFIWALPMTVIFTLGASLLVAITIIPSIASFILREKSKKKRKTILGKGLEFLNNKLYSKVLDLALTHKLIVLIAVSIIFAIAIYLIPIVGISFFPKAEKPFFRMSVELPEGKNLLATKKVVKEVESIISEYPEVDYYLGNIGHGHPKIYYNANSVNYAENYGELLVVLKSYDAKTFQLFIDKIRNRFQAYQAAEIVVKEFLQGPPSEAPVAIKIFGDDLSKLHQYAAEVETIVRKNQGVINVKNTMKGKLTDLQFNIDKEKAASLGVSIHEIDKTVQAAIMGKKIITFTDTEKDAYDVVLRYGLAGAFKIDDFNQIFIQSTTGNFIPLLQLGNISFRKVQKQITHLDAQRVASVYADIKKGETLGNTIAALREKMDDFNWDNGYYYEFKGDVENQKSSFQGLGMASLMTLFLIMATLVIQFRSFSQTLIVFVALPLALIGSVFMLFLVKVSFSFTAFIGMTSLIGIAINNSIILVDAANRYLGEGMKKTEAIRKAANNRFTPILLTTATTILGLLPITLTGSFLWAPMGWAIIGGLITSTIFILLVVPILFELLTRTKPALPK